MRHWEYRKQYLKLGWLKIKRILKSFCLKKKQIYTRENRKYEKLLKFFVVPRAKWMAQLLISERRCWGISPFKNPGDAGDSPLLLLLRNWHIAQCDKPAKRVIIRAFTKKNSLALIAFLNFSNNAFVSKYKPSKFVEFYILKIL